MREAEIQEMAQSSIEKYLSSDFEPKAEIIKGVLFYSAKKNGRCVAVRSPRMIGFEYDAAEALRNKLEELCAKPS